MPSYSGCRYRRGAGVISGKRIERSEVGTLGEFEALIERIARLGLTDVGETQH
jgi:hypothetical protein